MTVAFREVLTLEDALSMRHMTEFVDKICTNDALLRLDVNRHPIDRNANNSVIIIVYG